MQTCSLENFSVFLLCSASATLSMLELVVIQVLEVQKEEH